MQGDVQPALMPRVVLVLDEADQFALRTATLTAAALAKDDKTATPDTVAVAIVAAYLAARERLSAVDAPVFPAS